MIEYRAFRQISSGQFTNRLDGNPGSPDEVALAEVSDATEIPLDDLEVVRAESEIEIGVVGLPSLFGSKAPLVSLRGPDPVAEAATQKAQAHEAAIQAEIRAMAEERLAAR